MRATDAGSTASRTHAKSLLGPYHGSVAPRHPKRGRLLLPQALAAAGPLPDIEVDEEIYEEVIASQITMGRSYVRLLLPER
jgi:hypothetical protein